MIVLEIIGAVIVVGLLALGVERYVDWLKTKSTANKQINGDNNAQN